jgi:hypothetical protein
MGAQPTPVSPPLSRGDGIEYKAYARAYEEGGAVLSLIATCSYPIGGYSIFFEGRSATDEFELLEKAPQIAPQLVTYYVASWTSGQRLVKPPTHVEIRDAHGDHRVKVESWD